MTAPIAQNQYTESKMAEALKVDTETNCNQQIQITEHFFLSKYSTSTQIDYQYVSI